ncbi:MAG: hypothetical protein H0U87_11130, partial [Acidobacteria bacterium]|nr:hypothetical protein [Acidobacteriota bacterium]
MNRQNIWVHIAIAAVIISFAAVLGRLERMRSDLKFIGKNDERTASKPNAPTTKRATKSAATATGEPEVLVKFRPEVTSAQIERIAAKNNDRVEDSIEAVKNLTAIDDLDDADAETVA